MAAKMAAIIKRFMYFALTIVFWIPNCTLFDILKDKSALEIS